MKAESSTVSVSPSVILMTVPVKVSAINRPCHKSDTHAANTRRITLVLEQRLTVDKQRAFICRYRKRSEAILGHTSLDNVRVNAVAICAFSYSRDDPLIVRSWSINIPLTKFARRSSLSASDDSPNTCARSEGSAPHLLSALLSV